MKMNVTIGNHAYSFSSLKEVFAKANEEKSGDRLAGIAAESVQERIAAKKLLSTWTLGDIRDRPLLLPKEDEVSKIIEEQIDEEVFASIERWTVSDLREYILDDRTDDMEIKRIASGLNSEMIAAMTKIMSNLDLIHAANKIEVITTCCTTIGQKGTLASLKEGLAYGVGDAVIGINPVNDTVDNVKRLLEASKTFIADWKVPTQNCVLAHVTTQMSAIEAGAPADLIFQSIAGSEAANRSFGISASMLKEASHMMQASGKGAGVNQLYFETGQGSELSAEAHFGIDQLTMEARNYGFAKYFNPFIVNTVVGFIGPEYLYDSKQVIRAGLEDHFMGKMHGLPMGVDVCYTNHMVADQNDMEDLGVLLAAAGVNFLIATPMGDDCMLNYQSLSYHDIAALRQTLGKEPSPEFKTWLENTGILEGGKLSRIAGNPLLFS